MGSLYRIKGKNIKNYKHINVYSLDLLRNCKLGKFIVRNNFVFDGAQIKDLNLKNYFPQLNNEDYYEMMYNPESMLAPEPEIEDEFFISEDEIMVHEVGFYFTPSIFKKTRIPLVILDENTKSVNKREYLKKHVKKVVLNDNLESIGDSAFKNNEIENITLNSELKEIGENAFANNKIDSIIFNNKLEVIKSFAFKSNYISSLELPESIRVIGFEAFARNNLKHVILPDNIEKISSQAFDRTVSFTYRNIFIDKFEAHKFGNNNIFKIAFIKSKVPNFDFKNIDVEEFDIIPMSVDGIKGFVNNRKRYYKFKKELNISDDFDFEDDMDYFIPTQSIDFMRLCYVLGYFNSNGEKLTEIENDIRKIYDEIGKTGISKSFSRLRFVDYNKKIAEVIRKDLNPSLFPFVLAAFYNRYDEINKGIIKSRENDIAKLNTARKKLALKNMDTSEVEQTLKIMKKNLKNYDLNDVMNYITYNTFEIKKENKEMEKVLPYLIGNINNEGFEALNRLLTAAKKVEKNNLYEFKGEANNLEYEWLNNADPLNLVLGYIVDCCAKYKGAGEDIMIQSMTNPNFKNLVVYNGSEVLAKTTAFYNNDYILCNNIEVSRSYLESSKTSYDDLEKLCLTIIEALTIQAKKLGVSEVRIGMLRNDLNSFILDLGINVERRRLLDNYNFKNYEGDANNAFYGQAIVYKK